MPGCLGDPHLVSERHAADSLGGRVDVEDDLGTRRGPLQVASHPDPQLVDVGVLAVVRGDGQGVGDGQELWERRWVSLGVFERVLCV